jgi:hypothetical protein
VSLSSGFRVPVIADHTPAGHGRCAQGAVLEPNVLQWLLAI